MAKWWGMAGRYTGSYLDRCNGWRAVAILGRHQPSFTRQTHPQNILSNPPRGSVGEGGDLCPGCAPDSIVKIGVSNMPHGRLMVLVAGGLMIISLPVGSRASSATHALTTIQPGSIATPIHTPGVLRRPGAAEKWSRFVCIGPIRSGRDEYAAGYGSVPPDPSDRL